MLVELAHACQGVLRTKEKKEKQLVEEREGVEKARAKLSEQLQQLKPLETRVFACARRLSKLHHQEFSEMGEFVAEPKQTPAAQALQATAAASLEEAKPLLRALPVDALEEMRSTETPSAPLVEAVEAICVLLETKPNFIAAQNRLMRTPEGFLRRLLSYDVAAVPISAANRLRRYTEAPPPPASEVVATALHRWVLAVLKCDQANDEAKMSIEQHSCTMPMQVAIMHGQAHSKACPGLGPCDDGRL